MFSQVSATGSVLLVYSDASFIGAKTFPASASPGMHQHRFSFGNLMVVSVQVIIDCFTAEMFALSANQKDVSVATCFVCSNHFQLKLDLCSFERLCSKFFPANIVLMNGQTAKFKTISSTVLPRFERLIYVTCKFISIFFNNHEAGTLILD